MATNPPRTVEDLLSWLRGLPAAERIHLARLLADTKTTRELAALGDATIYDLTRGAKAADVAGQLGLTAKQIKRAVEQHYSRQRASTPGRAESA